MAIYSKILEIITGVARTVDLSTNTLSLGGAQLNGSTSGAFTQIASATTTPHSITWPAAQAAGSGYVLSNNGSGVLTWVAGSAGSVTSVALADSTGIFNITGSPVTSTGTLTLSSLKSQTANTFFAAPNGAPGAPTFRTIVAADVPTLNQNTTGTAANITGTSNSTLTTLSALSLPATQLTGTLQAAQEPAHTGDVTNTAGSLALSLVATTNATLTTLSSLSLPTTQLSGKVTLAQLPNIANNTILGNNAGSTGPTLALTVAQINAILPVFTSSLNGLAPLSGGGTTNFLRADGTWASPSGSGANSALSNLSAVAINTSLLPGITNSISLGSSSFSWAGLYATTAYDASGISSVLLSSRQLANTSGTLIADWSGTGLSLYHTTLMNGATSGTFGQLASATTTSYTITWPAAQASGTQVLQNNGSGVLSWATASAGTVTSVAFADASTTPIYSITGSPVTGSGTLTQTLTTQTANTVFAGPSTGGAVQPSFRALVAADIPSLSATYLPLAGGTMSGAINMGSHQINALATPSVSTDAATKGYVDAAISGLTWQGPAKAYAASNVPLTGGATLTIDGYSVANGDLVILGNQTTASQNGEYSASGIGTAYVLTANGLPTAAGDAWLILKGTVYGDSAFVANAAVPAATFTEFAGPTAYTFSPPLSLTGSTVSITLATGSANGYLSSTDWNTFNNKQAAGNYITALTGDVTAAGPGSAAATIAANAVTYAKFQQVAASSLVGNATGSSANATGITLGATLTFSGSALQTVAMTGDITTSANSFATTLATVNSNVGTFTNATVTVNAKGLVTAASSGSTASTAVTRTLVAGQTFTANTSYAVRWGLTANGETSGRIYAADITTSSFDLFYVIGMASSGTTVTAGNNITVTTLGSFTLSSADTAFAANTDGAPVFLTATGTFSTTAPSTAGQALTRIGVVQVRSATVTSNIIDVHAVAVGVN